jgi:hypothetical protein
LIRERDAPVVGRRDANNVIDMASAILTAVARAH